jgi:hypothetical protein
MTAFELMIHLQSRGECCSNARADEQNPQCLSTIMSFVPPFVARKENDIRLRFNETGFQRTIRGSDRFQSA